MSLFLPMLLKLLPLYLSIILGYIAGRFLKTSSNDIAGILFYLINPLIIFNGIANTKLSESILFLPVITFLISCFLCLAFYWASARIWHDSTKNLAALSAGYGNGGYFGLPLALLFFDEQGEGVYMMALMGMIFYENTLGFYICAKGSHSGLEAFYKLIRLPTLYAFALALILNFIHLPLPETFHDFMCHIKGTYLVLGMMIIGIGLGRLKQFVIDYSFIGITFLAKFVAWPLLVISLIYLDIHWWHIYPVDVHQALILLSIVPIAVSTVLIALETKLHPEKASMALLLSTLFALLYVPLMVALFIPDAKVRIMCN